MRLLISFFLAVFLFCSSSFAQDTLYIHKAGQVVYKKAINDFDSLCYSYKPLLTGTLTDIDGNSYHWIQIGTQKWMVENLKTTKFRTGESITNITDATTWINISFAAWCDYNNNSTFGARFGKLYNWYAVNDARRIAPDGWHIPTDTEWSVLENYLTANGYNYDESKTGNKYAKALADSTLWTIRTEDGSIGNNLLLNNASGFKGLPAGYRGGYDGGFDAVYGNALWWSSTVATTETGWIRTLSSALNYANRYDFNKKYGLSVRCIKD